MRPPLRVIVANTLFLWAAMALAAVAWWPIHQDARMVLAVAVAVVLGTGIAVAGAVQRWSSAVVVPLTVAVFAATGVAVAVPDRAVAGVLPSLQGLLDLFSGVALGWRQLLTISLPVGSYQALLVPLYAVMLTGSVLAATLALRSRAGDAAVVVPFILLVVGVAFGGREPERPVAVALGLLAVLLLWLLWRRGHRRRVALTAAGATGQARRATGARTLLAASLVLLVAGASAVAATTALAPAAHRAVLRDTVVQPFDPREHPSPLAGFRRYLLDERADEVMLTVEGLPAGARLRLASLDSYDGVVFAVGSEQDPTGSGSFQRVPAGIDRSGDTGARVQLRVTVDGYAGVWLPTVGDLERVEFTGAGSSALRDAFFANAETGTAVVSSGLEEGDSYLLTALLPIQPAESALADATPGSAVVPPLEVPDAVAATVTRYAGQEGSASAGRRLLAALTGLRSEGYVSHGIDPDEPPSRSGHSVDRVTELLGGRQMIGDAEQYAVAAALMARELGFPSRVVFGFDPGQAGGGEVAVTGSMVSAWIEVDTAEYGWVALDATPEPRPIPDAPPDDPSSVSRPQSVVQPPVREPEQADTQSSTEASDEPPAEQPAWLLALLAVARVAGVALTVLAVLAAPFLGVVAAKLRRRRRRRHAATALERITGGWREFEDAALDRGLRVEPGATRAEFAAAVGGARSASLARVTDRAVFSPDPPADPEADAVWTAVDELTAALDEDRGRWERLRARVSLRSLARYHRGRKGARR